MHPTTQKILSLLTLQEKKQIYWLLLSMLIMGLLETTGIASIMPFMAVLADPEIIKANSTLLQIYNFLGCSNNNQFIFFLGMGVLLILIVTNSFSAYTSWRLLRFIFLCGHNLSGRLFEKYLYNPYSFFLNHNSSVLTNNVLAEVGRVIVGVLNPAMYIVSRSIISLCILLLLIVMDPLLALVIFTVCGGSYTAVFMFSRKTLSIKGKISSKSQGERYKIVGEGLGGIKDLKLLGREAEYLHRYLRPSYSFATSESTNRTITLLPKYALETIVFGGILLIILYLTGSKQNTANVLPIISLYAFACYRLMPAFNAVFQSIAQIRYHSAALDIIHGHLHPLPALERLPIDDDLQRAKILINDGVKLKNISFSYKKNSPKIIDKLSLFIKANTTVAFVGKTGSGKTTLIDIILGLLSPDSGEMFIDDTLVMKTNLRSWQENTGYVAQQIYLADDTVTRNIAFGIPDREIDRQAVINAAKIADIHNFVTEDLANGYDTFLGDRGVRLSGGQRQRMGIARALYHDPKVLILDEATSSLDNVTENVIMNAVNSLAHKKTIILIAHRLTTVKKCDSIYLLSQGKVCANGTYEELIANNAIFREMAELGISGSNKQSHNRDKWSEIV